MSLSGFSEELAELIGIIIGDGHIINKKYADRHVYRLEIDLNSSEDKEYIPHVFDLISSLFGVSPKKKVRNDGRTTLVVNQRGIVEYLISLGLPAGKKRGLFKIPLWALENKRSSAAFLRGLFDTDGSLFFAKRGTYKMNSYPVIELKQYDPFLIDQVFSLVNALGFKAVKCADKIQLNGKTNLNNWLNKIGMSNPNSYSRYIIWRKLGFCAPNTTFNERCAILESNLNLGPIN